MPVAFQGELGALAEDAIQMLFGAAGIPVPCASYLDALHAVADARVERAMLSIENTLIGSDTPAHEAIDRVPAVHAVAETVVAVHYCLLGPPGASLDTISTVLSDSVVLAQCRSFFSAHPRIQTHGVFDTAAAAREVAQLGDPSFGALASPAAAARYNLKVVVAHVEDRHDNQTRFVAFGREPAALADGTPVRTMVVFTTRDVPGSLLIALQPLADQKVNLRRIVTHPAGEPWSYRFFVEFDHEFGNANATAALDAIARRTAAMRLVGTFARWQPGRRGSIGWTPTDAPVIA